MSKHRWTVKTCDTVEALATELASCVWTLCTAFRLPLAEGGLLLTNVSASEDSIPEFNVLLLDEEQDRQVLDVERGTVAMGRLEAPVLYVISAQGTAEEILETLRTILPPGEKCETATICRVLLDSAEVHSGECCA